MNQIEMESELRADAVEASFEAESQCLGSAFLQYFAWLSFDPNTIFQMFVFEDRVFFVKAGSAANQLPAIIHGGATPVLLRDFGRERLPSIDEARELVRSNPGGRLLRVPAPVAASNELPLTDVQRVTFKRRGLFARGLHFALRDGSKRFYRWREISELKKAALLLGRVLGSQLSVQD